MFNDDSLSLQLHDILEQNITSTYGKRFKTEKTTEAFIHLYAISRWKTLPRATL